MSQMRKVVVTHIEDGIAVLKTEDGQELRWPVKDLPLGTSEGNSLLLLARTETEAVSDDREQTRKLLNEILQSE